jgi:beta-glucosidase/6-phospho-beta-glucosidase/beta-galactosidase
MSVNYAPDAPPFAALQHGDKCGTSNDFWNLYEADIERAAQLNVKLFRLSIEWSRIMPRRGEVDVAAVQRYHQIFDVMDRCMVQLVASCDAVVSCM